MIPFFVNVVNNCFALFVCDDCKFKAFFVIYKKINAFVHKFQCIANKMKPTVFCGGFSTFW